MRTPRYLPRVRNARSQTPDPVEKSGEVAGVGDVQRGGGYSPIASEFKVDFKPRCRPASKRRSRG